jgi:hypothetical protein
LEIKTVAHIFGVLFSTIGSGFALILAKNGIGYIVSDFFTNSSVHPAHIYLSSILTTTLCVYASCTELPDDVFSDQIPSFGYILEGLGMERLAYSMFILNILRPYGIFNDRLVI